MKTINLDRPIVRPESEINSLDLRKPNAGELRGLSLIDIANLKTETLIKLLPRLVIPTISEAEVAGLEPGDFMALAAEVAGFLLQKADHPDFQSK